MSKKQLLLVKPAIGHKLENWCVHPPSDCGKGEVLFDEEVQFEDGYRMAIQAIASLDPSNEPIWTQGVLFTPEGTEVGCTDVGEGFWEEYQVGDYTCMVEPELTAWCVVYRDKGANPFSAEVFKCEAEDYDHAEEQCENAYPDADILWIVDTDNPQDAVDNWLTAGEKE
jgi:hypothetical protein